MSEPLKTPDEWCKAKGIRVLDPDGWRRTGDPAWDEPIGEADFAARAGMSTVGPYDWGHPVTAPVPAPDVAALCDQLEQLRAAATDGPWRYDPRIAGDGVLHGADGTPTASTYGSRKNAALIGALVNAAPTLIAAAREAAAVKAAVLRLAADLAAEALQLARGDESEHSLAYASIADRICAVVAAAVTEATR